MSRKNPRRTPTGQRTYTVTGLLRRQYPQGEDILGEVDSRYHPEIDRVTEEVDKKVPASVSSWEYVSIEALSAVADLYDFAGNIKYKLRVTVMLED